MNMKSATIDRKGEQISCLHYIWIETRDAARPLACKWFIGELTTSTEFRVKRNDAI